MEERELADKRRHYEFMMRLHKAAENSPRYRDIAPRLKIRPPSMEDYTDRRNVSMRYENWKITAEELKVREAQTQSHRPSSDKNDMLGIRRRSLQNQDSVAPNTANTPTSKSAGNLSNSSSAPQLKQTLSNTSAKSAILNMANQKRSSSEKDKSRKS